MTPSPRQPLYIINNGASQNVSTFAAPRHDRWRIVRRFVREFSIAVIIAGFAIVWFIIMLSLNGGR